MTKHDEKEIHLLPVLPLRGLTAFPEMLIHFDVGRLMSIKALEAAMKEGQKLFLTGQIDIKNDSPKADDLFKIGTICTIKQIMRIPADNIRVLVEGKKRAIANSFKTFEENGCIYAEVNELENEHPYSAYRREKALIRTAQQRFEEYAEYMQRIPKDVRITVAEGGEIGYIADHIAQNIYVDYQIKQEILEELCVTKRISKVINLLTNEIEILKVESEIQDKVREQIDKNQREYYLREQIKIIQSELGENDTDAEIDEYREKIKKLNLQDEHAQKLLSEVTRLSKMSSTSAESGVIRTYLDTVLALPWNEKTKEQKNITKAKNILDNDHYGMEKVKERILEFLAVKALAPNLKGNVLCLAGPPGVGKTSVARSIAKAMGRNYVRLSLGGVRDEADIRGHRKTYIGAMAGRIMNAMSQAKSKNPLMLMDEIDKMGNDFRGDPASAMLEVLDSEQNNSFRDHYIELPFDLSDVVFVTTANDISSIPRALLDRMEVIELQSYTQEEKLQIAKRHLLKKQFLKHGIKENQIDIDDFAINKIISGYTKEAGVRKLEQVIAKLCRRCAKRIVDEKPDKIIVNKENIEEILGNPKYKDDFISRKNQIGVVNGLAWTSVGGEMLQAEVAVVDGSGKIEVTGNLGDVMKESARAALTFVRSIADELDIEPNFYKEMDMHIHFPEAAIPKDGPSAGITITTALISALTNAPVRADVAMTGEVTLRGRVLPIGGLREKTMAAYRSGIKTVIIPKDNEPDLEEVLDVVKKNVKFVIAENMDTVMKTAIDFGKRIPKRKTKISKQPHAIPHTTASIPTMTQ